MQCRATRQHNILALARMRGWRPHMYSYRMLRRYSHSGLSSSAPPPGEDTWLPCAGCGVTSTLGTPNMAGLSPLQQIRFVHNLQIQDET